MAACRSPAGWHDHIGAGQYRRSVWRAPASRLWRGGCLRPPRRASRASSALRAEWLDLGDPSPCQPCTPRLVAGDATAEVLPDATGGCPWLVRPKVRLPAGAAAALHGRVGAERQKHHAPGDDPCCRPDATYRNQCVDGWVMGYPARARWRRRRRGSEAFQPRSSGWKETGSGERQPPGGKEIRRCLLVCGSPQSPSRPKVICVQADDRPDQHPPAAPC